MEDMQCLDGLMGTFPPLTGLLHEIQSKSLHFYNDIFCVLFRNLFLSATSYDLGCCYFFCEDYARYKPS